MPLPHEYQSIRTGRDEFWTLILRAMVMIAGRCHGVDASPVSPQHHVGRTASVVVQPIAVQLVTLGHPEDVIATAVSRHDQRLVFVVVVIQRFAVV